MDVEFEWNEWKGFQNKKKHNVSFEEAETVFLDENAILIHDPEHSDEEDRFIILGLSAAARLLVVCHCFRRKNSLIRIISARKAVKKESIQYQGGVYEKRI